MNQVAHSTSAVRASLCLARGLSTRTTWILRSIQATRVLTIGASASCDWQVHAPGVAEHALSVAFIDGALYVASGPNAVVTLDGEPLFEAWRALRGPALLKLGAAEIEVVCHDEQSDEESTSERERVTLPPEAWARGGVSLGQGTTGEQRLSRTPLVDIPTLLGATVGSQLQHGQMWRAISFVLFTGVAYHAWLVLLDHL